MSEAATLPSSSANAEERPCAGAAVRAVLFDVDGTLVDSNDLHAGAWREAFLHFGIDVPLEEVRFQIGKGGDNLLPTLLPNLSEAQRKELEEHRGELFKKLYLPRAMPFPGVRELLERIKGDGHKIVLATSAHQDELSFHVGLIGAEDLIDARTSKDDVESSKPCPDIFEAALAKVDPIGADESIVVGDSPWDIKAAARAGLRAIGFRSGGFPDEALIEAGACTLYDGAAELLARYDDSPLARHG